MFIQLQLLIMAGAIHAAPPLFSTEVEQATIIEGEQTISMITMKTSIINSAIDLKKEITGKLENMTQGNKTEMETQIMEAYVPFLKHFLWECTMKIHEINLLDNFFHLFSINFKSTNAQFQTIPYISADESKNHNKIKDSMIKLDTTIMDYIFKMRNSQTTSTEAYQLEIAVFSESLKKILSTDADILPIFCNENTQLATFNRIIGQYKKDNETMETLQDKLLQVKKNFVARIKTFFPEITEATQEPRRSKRNLWGSMWGTILSLPTSDQVDEIRHSQDVLLLNERQISQRFEKFDKTSELIAKELEISEDNFKKIKGTQQTEPHRKTSVDGSFF